MEHPAPRVVRLEDNVHARGWRDPYRILVLPFPRAAIALRAGRGKGMAVQVDRMYPRPDIQKTDADGLTLADPNN